MIDERDRVAIDHALSRDGGPHADELRKVLGVGLREPDLPQLERVLYALESEHIRPTLGTRDLPVDIQETLLNALTPLMFRVLGVRAVGTLSKLALEARRRLDAERRKLELVRRRLPEDDAKALEMLLGYLSTKPAPAMLGALESERPELVAEARAERARRTDTSALTDHTQLVSALRSGRDHTQIARGLQRILAAIPRVDTLVEAAIDAEDPDVVLVASSLAAMLEMPEHASAMLRHVMANSSDAPVLVALAAKLDPKMTRQALGVMLADAAWGNPEEPEYQLTRARARALMAARCILPRVGSPMKGVSLDAAQTQTQDVGDVPELVERHLACWAMLGTN
ncbi:MAG: hypothetical protein AAGI01_09110 [Myxococcota bacterium]